MSRCQICCHHPGLHLVLDSPLVSQGAEGLRSWGPSDPAPDLAGIRMASLPGACQPMVGNSRSLAVEGTRTWTELSDITAHYLR